MGEFRDCRFGGKVTHGRFIQKPYDRLFRDCSIQCEHEGFRKPSVTPEHCAACPIPDQLALIAVLKTAVRSAQDARQCMRDYDLEKGDEGPVTTSVWHDADVAANAALDAAIRALEERG